MTTSSGFSAALAQEKKHTLPTSRTSLGTGGWSSMTQDTLEGNETKVFYSLVRLSHCPQPAATEWEELAHAPAAHGRADGPSGAGRLPHLVAGNPWTRVKNKGGDCPPELLMFCLCVWRSGCVSAAFGVSVSSHVQVRFRSLLGLWAEIKCR